MPTQIARYGTKRGAQRYANEIMAVHCLTIRDAKPELATGFQYAVRVTMKDGRSALAARRPKHFGRRAKP